MKRTITIFDYRRKAMRSVEAEIIGEHMAIHKTLDEGIRGWVITHIPTGWRVDPLAESPLRYAMDIPVRRVRALAKALSVLPWGKVKTPKSKKALAEIRPLWIEIIEKWKASK